MFYGRYNSVVRHKNSLICTFTFYLWKLSCWRKLSKNIYGCILGYVLTINNFYNKRQDRWLRAFTSIFNYQWISFKSLPSSCSAYCIQGVPKCPTNELWILRSKMKRLYKYGSVFLADKFWDTLYIKKCLNIQCHPLRIKTYHDAFRTT